MHLISKFNKGFRFLLCVIDVYSKYEWIISLKDKKATTITNGFQKVSYESNCKLIKAVNFSIDRWNRFCRVKTERFIQCMMKKNLLLLKDSLES